MSEVDSSSKDEQVEESKGGARRILLPAVILVLVAVVAGFVGNSIASSSYEAAAKAERELEIDLHRSGLQPLDVDDTIYVTGHMSPDSDTVSSSIGYARLLSALGYEAEPVVLGPINKETAFILESAGVEEPELLEDASGKYMALVDHGDVELSASGLEDANIVSIVDHHGAGTVSTANQIVYDARPLGATATIVWLRYRDYGVDLDAQTAKVLLGGLLSDTINLKANVTDADREACKELAAIAGVTDVDAYYTDLYKALISHEGQTDEEIFDSDLKVYESGGTKYAIGVVNVYDEEEAKALVPRMRTVMAAQRAFLGVDMSFAQVSIFHDDISVAYLVGSDEAADAVLEEAYGDKATREGVAFVLSPGISRKKDLVPAISGVLAAHPSE